MMTQQSSPLPGRRPSSVLLLGEWGECPGKRWGGPGDQKERMRQNKDSWTQKWRRKPGGTLGQTWGLDPRSATSSLCDLGQAMAPL